MPIIRAKLLLSETQKTNLSIRNMIKHLHSLPLPEIVLISDNTIKLPTITRATFDESTIMHAIREIPHIAFFFFFFSELCWGKAMVVYTMPQQRKKEERRRLRRERGQIKFIDLGFERWQIVRFRKARGRQDVP